MIVNLNPRELHLLHSIMRPLASICKPGNPAYYEMAVKLISERLNRPMNSPGGNAMMMSIAQKIAYAQMGEELESFLAEANNIELENTKTQSLKKVTNFSDIHQEVLSMINKYPECSRSELANYLGWPINRVTPRVRELLDMEKISVSGTKYDDVTERNVETLVLI